MGEPLLRISEFHYPHAKARRIVDEVIVRLGGVVGEDEQVVLSFGDVELTENYRDLVDRVRRGAVVPKIQETIDQADVVFGGCLPGISSVNYQLAHAVEWAGWKATSQGPFRAYPAHWELTNDILHYRRETCAASDQPDLVACTRAYRGYLSACVAIVEAFINRYVRRASFDGFASEQFSRLQKATLLQERIELWHDCFATDPDSSFFEQREWSAFSHLRDRRNRLVHAADPVFMYSIREIKRDLNAVRIGVGRLLERMRRYRC